MKWGILAKGFQRIGLCVCISFIVNFPGSIFAQDLGVENVSVFPLQGKSGDTVTLTAEIKNYSWMAFSIQYGWYLSSDADIDPAEDMAIGDIITDYRYLYENQSLTVSTSVTLPAFFDAQAPSYIGLILDPHNLYDENPENNIGSTMFTYTGTPPGTISDPRGDNYLDAVCVATGITAGNLNIDITFAAPPGSTISLIMGMDLDQNPYTTGTNTTLPGTEAMVSLVFEKLTQSSVVSLQTNAGTYSLANAVLSDNTLSFTIPLSLVGNNDAMDLFWALDHSVSPTADFDRIPDIGVFALDTWEVVVRQPGDSTIHVQVSDPVAQPGEDEFPDIIHMAADVCGDQFHMILTFNHGVDVMDMPATSEGLFVWVDMDSDADLSTGFANAGRTPPSMGIDHRLTLQIDDLAGVVPKLLYDSDGDGDPETRIMGLPVNDMFMRLEDNQIILRIPLVYLGYGDGTGALAVTTLNSRDILGGTMDRLPESGAWDLQQDCLLVRQTCGANIRSIKDPADDSLYGAGGWDNDELMNAQICLGDDAIIFSIDYESYLLSNDGATLIFLDTDQNPATGQSTPNLAGNLTLGADYILRTYWNYIELRQETYLFKMVPPEQVYTVTQLATPTQADRLYLTLPLDLLGSPGTAVDILIRTASWGGGGSGILLPNDDLPNTTVVNFPVQPDLIPGDFNGDNAVDGRDLAVWIQNPGIMALVDLAASFGLTGG
jgi:hypothetical protein